MRRVEGWGGDGVGQEGQGRGGTQRGPKPTRSLSQDLRVSAQEQKKAVHFSPWSCPGPQHANVAAHPAGLPPLASAGEGAERAGPRAWPRSSARPRDRGQRGGAAPRPAPMPAPPPSTPPRGPRAPTGSSGHPERREVLPSPGTPPGAVCTGA